MQSIFVPILDPVNVHVKSRKLQETCCLPIGCLRAASFPSASFSTAAVSKFLRISTRPSSAAVECQKNDSQPRKVPPHAQSAVGRAKGEGDENEGRDELKKRRGGRHAAAVGAHRLFHCHRYFPSSPGRKNRKMFTVIFGEDYHYW